MSVSSSQSLAEILNNFPNLSLNSNNRIVCSLTMHEMAPNAKAVNEYLNGKKYKKVKDWYSHDYSHLEPYIIAHKSDSKLLWCKLTKQTINKIPEVIEKHINGKKYLRLKKEYESKKEKKSKSKEEVDFWVISIIIF